MPECGVTSSPDAERPVHELRYPRTTRYGWAWTTASGERRVRFLDPVRDLGRPSMAALMRRLSAERQLRELPAETLATQSQPWPDWVIDSPAGLLPCHRYRQHKLMMVNNNGSLPRCHLEELVYRSGIHWLWHNDWDDQLYRRFFAQPFHSRSLKVTWFVDPPQQEGTGDELSIPDGPRLVYCGRMDPEKRVHSLIHLLALLRDTGARLVLTGAFEPTVEGAEYRAHVERLIQSFDLTDRVHQLGFVSRSLQAAVLGQADLMVNLTVNHDETFGMAQAEALSLGTPVLAAAWGGLKEVVTPECGYLAETLVSDAGTFVDLHAAARFVRRFLADAELRAQMSRAAMTRGGRFRFSAFVSDLDQHLSSRVAAVPEIDPKSNVHALVRQVLSPALLERIEPYLNQRAMEQTLSEVHALRNGTALEKNEWARFAIIDPERHDDFVRKNYQFIYEPYGALTPASAARRASPEARLFPLREASEWQGDSVITHDLVFGGQRFDLSATAARVLRACVARPGVSVAELVANGPDPVAVVLDGSKELLAHGLALPV